MTMRLDENNNIRLSFCRRIIFRRGTGKRVLHDVRRGEARVHEISRNNDVYSNVE